MRQVVFKWSFDGMQHRIPPRREPREETEQRYPAGWWIVPLLFIALFCWALVFLLFF